MKSSYGWIGIGWIALVMISAMCYFVYFTVDLLKQDTTVLPWLLLPAAGVILVIAAVLSIPGILILLAAQPKPSRPTRSQFGGQTLGQLMTENKIGENAAKKDSGKGPYRA